MQTDTSLLRLGQVARYLRLDADWLLAEARAGKIPHVKAGRVWLFSPEAVTKSLAQRAMQTEDLERSTGGSQ